MKTAVLMKRNLFGVSIHQNSKNELISATDLVKAGNLWRAKKEMQPFSMNKWFQNKTTKEFIKELENKYGTVKIPARGRGKHTWVHPLLFIDMALAIHPKLKIETYEWLLDQLIKNRNNSGDSFKLMCGALYVREKNKSKFEEKIKILSRLIRKECKIDEEERWEGANQEQLAQRDKIHKTITMLCEVLNNNSEAVRIGLEKYNEL